MSTIPKRTTRTQEYDLEEDDSYYTERRPTSTVRYTQPRQQVYQRGNKRNTIKPLVTQTVQITRRIF